MADVVSAVRSYLLGKQVVTDIIGQRLYLDVLPEYATLPAAIVYKISEDHHHLLSARSGIIYTTLKIECIAESRLTANSLAAAMYSSGIDSVKGVVNGVDIRGVAVQQGETNLIYTNSDGGDDHVYATQFDLVVIHKE